ncbi:hypothetical protein [uncultured Megasphaera sp.]|uniref:hypothetical protein n=1 Tax=uncultured Megasphaera sp. TaxID=165188 RepID=UPI0025D5E780|nr:hypothetical protein [uncultured Megasphaera sp.]
MYLNLGTIGKKKTRAPSPQGDKPPPQALLRPYNSMNLQHLNPNGGEAMRQRARLANDERLTTNGF